MSWTNDDYVVVRERESGRGAFAAADVGRGEVVGVFDGEVARFPLDAGRVVWGSEDGGMALHLSLTKTHLIALMPLLDEMDERFADGIDFINHSCSPNCRLSGFHKLTVTTTRAIAEGDELTIDYREMDLIEQGITCWCDVPESRKCRI